MRDNGAEGAFTLTGHAAVFDQPCDFGYFKEFIAPGAFKTALAVKPLEVVSNWQHDDRYILGHTLSGTLALREDAIGLYQRTQVAGTTYADDLRLLIERKDIQQASFAFTILAEEWDSKETATGEEITTTITEVGVLFDVTVCALGAYPQTDVAIEAASRARLDAAIRSGKVRGLSARAGQRGRSGMAGRGTGSPSPVDTARRRRHAAIRRAKQISQARTDAARANGRASRR
ncbi:MAG TPA: HK97 family phage prohead protease [Solirubrobacteraceae bacterium]|nr:HK97 family phage prohead protease [Solirubrobacteraceae bacterium]